MIEGEIRRYLREVIGLRLVAYMTVARSTRRVRQWIRGTRPIGVVTAQQLMLAYQAAQTLERGGKSVADIRAWFMGSNPRLDHLSPADMIRDSDPMDVAQRILHAARSFAHFR